MPKRIGIYHVEPLRTATEIEEMKLAIKRGKKGTPKRSELSERDSLIFLMGINTGLRVNDLVSLKVRDVKDKMILIFTKVKQTSVVKLTLACYKLKFSILSPINSQTSIYSPVRKDLRRFQQPKCIGS